MSDTVKIKYKGEPIDAGIGMLNFEQPEVGETYEVTKANWEKYDQDGWQLVGSKAKKAPTKKTPAKKKAK